MAFRPKEDATLAPPMKCSTLVVLLLLADVVVARQPGRETNPGTREVTGNTIVSTALPKAKLTFSKEFRYVGSQQVNLYGNAEAQEYLFAAAGGPGVVRKFYWIQFEHFLPTNSSTYNYASDRTTTIGGLTFIYDVKSWPDYAAMQIEDPQSDGAALARLLAQHGLNFPKRTVRVRMFHLPTPDHRSELMIIYGESLPVDSKVSVRQEGVQLDTESPQSADLFLQHALQNLTIDIR